MSAGIMPPANASASNRRSTLASNPASTLASKPTRLHQSRIPAAVCHSPPAVGWYQSSQPASPATPPMRPRPPFQRAPVTPHPCARPSCHLRRRVSKTGAVLAAPNPPSFATSPPPSSSLQHRATALARPPHIPPSLLTAYCCSRHPSPATRAILGTALSLRVVLPALNHELQPVAALPVPSIRPLSAPLRHSLAAAPASSGAAHRLRRTPPALTRQRSTTHQLTLASCRSPLRVLHYSLHTPAPSSAPYPCDDACGLLPHPPRPPTILRPARNATQARASSLGAGSAPPCKPWLLRRRIWRIATPASPLPTPHGPPRHPCIVLSVRTTSRPFALCSPKSRIRRLFALQSLTRQVLYTIPLTFPILLPPPPFSSSSLPTAISSKSNKGIRKVTHLLLSPQRRRRALPPSETVGPLESAMWPPERHAGALSHSPFPLTSSFGRGKENCRHSWLPLIPLHPRLETPLPNGSPLPDFKHRRHIARKSTRMDEGLEQGMGWDYWWKACPPASSEGKRFSKPSSPFVLSHSVSVSSVHVPFLSGFYLFISSDFLPFGACISEHPPPLLLRFSFYRHPHTESSFSFSGASRHFDRPS
ncbi:hypothetical protein B0H13DRAFT_2499443 [Mycena leptocephala]|nr:hypothetical protein B0H13DRAFT_2499443 [Mycena leptocephala]